METHANNNSQPIFHIIRRRPPAFLAQSRVSKKFHPCASLFCTLHNIFFLSLLLFFNSASCFASCGYQVSTYFGTIETSLESFRSFRGTDINVVVFLFSLQYGKIVSPNKIPFPYRNAKVGLLDRRKRNAPSVRNKLRIRQERNRRRDNIILCCSRGVKVKLRRQ